MNYDNLEITADDTGFCLKASREDGACTTWTRFYFDSDGTVEDTANAMTDLIAQLTTTRDELLAKHGTVDQEKVVTSKLEKPCKRS